MFSARLGRLIAGKVVYAMSCLAAAVLVVVSGYAHKAVADLDAIGGGITIGGSSSVGAMNILVMGLESRTNTAAADNGDAGGAVTVGANANTASPACTDL